MILFICCSLLITSACAMLDDGDKSSEAVKQTTISDSSQDTTSEQDPDPEKTGESMPAVNEPSFGLSVDEQVLVDQDDLVITLKKLIPDALMGPALQIRIENNVKQAATVQIRNLSVNNIMLTSVFVSEVAAGKKANENIVLMDSDLERAGIDVIKDIEFCFEVSDPETYKTKSRCLCHLDHPVA